MTDNYIAHDEELEQIENELKELSKIYQDEYNKSGKYFKPQNPRFILWCFYIPVMLIVILKNQFHLISINTSLILFAIVYIICLILISRKVKLPIVSKSRFLNNNLLKIKSDLLIRYSLEFQYISIDYDKIEFHLNQTAFARFKNIKK
jgi:hypothetical protein